MTLTQTLTLLSPELILCLAGLAVLGLDLAWRTEEKKGGLPYLALLWFIVALLATASLWGTEKPLLEMMAVDPLALFFKVVACVATGLVTLSSIEYMRERTPYRGEFYSLLLFSALAMMLISAATDLIMAYVAIEFLSITSYILAGYFRDDPKSNEAAIKYFLFGAVASAAMLYGLSLLYGATGSTNLEQIASSLTLSSSPSLRRLILPATVFLLAGFGFKIAAVPFHQWSPDAYEGAPTPATAFLSVGPKAAGFAVILRVFLTALPSFQVDWVALLAGISIVTMTLGNLVAIWQRNIKRMLAYSSIAQAGYILIGLVCLGPDNYGMGGVLLYLLAYLFTNLGAFVVVIAFSNATRSDDIEDYAGLIRRAPWLAGSLVVFFLSLVGIPPTAGFFGKVLIFAAAIRLQYFLLAAIGVANGVISLYYYFNVVRLMFFIPPKDKTPIYDPPLLRATLVLTLVMTLFIGVYPQPFIELAQGAARLLIF